MSRENAYILHTGLVIGLLLTLLPNGARANHRWTFPSNACVPLSPAPDVEAASSRFPSNIRDLRIIVGQEGKIELDKSLLEEDLAVSDLVGEDIVLPKPRTVRLRLRYTGDLRIPGGELRIDFLGRIALVGQWDKLRHQWVGGFSALPVEEQDGSRYIDFFLDYEKVLKSLWLKRCAFREKFNGLRVEGYGAVHYAPEQPFFRVTRTKKLQGSRKNNGKWWPNDPQCTPIKK